VAHHPHRKKISPLRQISAARNFSGNTAADWLFPESRGEHHLNYMKRLIILGLAVSSLTSCTTVIKDPAVSTTTTQTREEAVVTQPAATSTTTTTRASTTR
jgi:hypothetical protein